MEKLVSTQTDSKSETWSFYFSRMLNLALPNTLTSFSWIAQSVMGVYFVGRLGNVTYLDAFSLGNTWTGIFAFSIIIGFGAGMDTLVSQSFGQNDFRMCAIHLYRGFLVVSIASLPCYLILSYSYQIYCFIGIDPQVSYHAAKCVLALIPAVILQVPLILLEKFMFGQRIAKPQMIIQLTNTVFYPAYCYFFIFKLDMGYYGAAAARAFAQIVYISGMLIYLYYSGSCNKCFVKPTKEVLDGWKHYFNIALPTMLMICLEWWGSASLSILCARLGVADLGAHTVALNYACVLFYLCIGIGSATGTLVGNSIGEKSIPSAKAYAILGFIATVSLLGFVSIICIIFRKTLATLFTTNEEIVEKLNILIIICLISEFFDGMQGTLGKVLIGMGKQQFASLVNLCSYYVIMIPAGFTFGWILKYGVFGVWIALGLGSFIAALGFLAIILRQDWDIVVLNYFFI